MGIWDWVWLPLLVVGTLGMFAAAFRSPVERPRRRDFLPFVILLFWIGDALGGDSRSLTERVLKGCIVALFIASMLVTLVRWGRMRARERATTLSKLGEGQGAAKAS